MYQNLQLFRTAQALAAHAGTRQAVVSANIANADTPGYRARTVAPFSAAVAQAGGGSAPRATRAGHLIGATSGQPVRIAADDAAPASPNGNSVTIELEMLKAVEAKRAHDRALAVYRHAMGVLRTSLGR